MRKRASIIVKLLLLAYVAQASVGLVVGTMVAWNTPEGKKAIETISMLMKKWEAR